MRGSNKQIKEVIDSAIGSDSICVSVRETLEMHLFDIAVEHAKRAVGDIDRNDMRKMQEELKNSLIAIVMAHCCLEALANSIGMKFYGTHPKSERRKKWKEIEGLALPNKWQHLATVAYQEKTRTQEKRTLPKSVKNLLEELHSLRHSLVHYQAMPEYIYSLRRTSKNEPVSPEMKKYTSKEAIRAVGTVITTVEAFNTLARKEYGIWIEPLLKKHSIEVHKKEVQGEYLEFYMIIKR